MKSRTNCVQQHRRTSVHDVYGGTQGQSLYDRTFTGSIVSVGLLERLEEVLKENSWSARDWARLAGLPEPTHLYTTMRRLRSNPDARLDVATLAALADAAGVTLDWLALGREPRHSVAGRPDSRYPSRAQAVAAAKLLGLPDQAIRTVETVEDFDTDPGADYWLQRIRLAAFELSANHVRLLPPAPGER